MSTLSDVLVVTDEGQLGDLIETEHNLVVKFTQPATCRPCRAFAPHFVAVASSIEAATFVSVDLDEVPEAMVYYGIQSVPTVMLYRDGQLVKNLKERSAVKFKKEIEGAL